MSRVIVGVDPHKKSVTIEAIDEQGKKLATGRFGTATRDYKEMLRYVREQWPHHRWAIEGAHGVGRPLAQRLLADGETVVDVPAKLAARVRVFDTGNARKTDATDAHAVAAVALRTPNLRVLSFDEELVALRLLVDRRDELSARRVQRLTRGPAPPLPRHCHLGDRRSEVGQAGVRTAHERGAEQPGRAKEPP